MLKPRLVAEGMTTVYETLERPLVATLARMEARGVSIDRNILSRLSGEFAQGMARIEAEIQTLVGVPLNLGSPKQISDVLFGQMGLPGGKKTPTGAWSTNASVLEDLAEEGHELPRKILDWRQLSKLKSTYTDALPSYVNPTTHRVHTSFAHGLDDDGAAVVVGAEPAEHPDPQRGGRRIRRAFVAGAGAQADLGRLQPDRAAPAGPYRRSRLAEEGLRRRARHSRDDGLAKCSACRSQGMPSEVRRRAKAINFGIIYGISAFGLANQLGIPREEAGAYIRKYFERFPGIRDYMEATKKRARADGYVTTIFGRKCHFPRINASNPSRARLQRARGDQRADPGLGRRHHPPRHDAHGRRAGRRRSLSARMLLQVHDELVFEAPDAEVEATIALVAKVMSQAPVPALALDVPLLVDARAADNWDEAH